MAIVSVIMPALNVAPFIEACINSVLTQSLTDFEMLIIDAGSTDGTTEIVKKMSDNDRRIGLLSSSVRSYGHQMNMGLEAAQGKYIFILETDDMMGKDALKSLVAYMEHDDKLDFVKGYPIVFYDLFNNANYELSSRYFSSNDYILGLVFSPLDNPKLLFRDIFLWLGLYRKSFLDNIRFNETPGAAFQDQGFLLKTLSQAKRAMYVDIPVYLYRQNNPNSSIYQPKGFSQIIEEYSLNETYLDTLPEQWRPYFYMRMLQQTLSRYKLMALFGRFWDIATPDIERLRAKFKEISSNGWLEKDILTEEQNCFLPLFFENIKSPYEFYKKNNVTLIKKYESILSWADRKEIVIYGAGRYGQFIHAFLSLNYKAENIKCFIDGSEKLQNQTVQGIKVLSPQEGLIKFKDDYFIVAVGKYSGEVKDTLADYGIDAQHILFENIVIDTSMLIADFSSKRDE